MVEEGYKEGGESVDGVLDRLKPDLERVSGHGEVVK